MRLITKGTMNSKIVLAFFAGAVLASGIVYMAVRNEPMAKPARVASAPVKPIYISPDPAVTPEPPTNPSAERAVIPPAETRELPGESSLDRPARKARAEKVIPEQAKRDKPSPLSPPQQHAQVAQVTRPDQPAGRPDAPPLKEPINKERPINDANVGAPPASPTAAQPPLAPVPEAPKETAPPPPETPQPHTVTIAAGTILPVRIGETIRADHNQPGDTFLATLDRPLIVDGFVIAERGARVEGRIVEAEVAGRVKGLSHLAIELVKLSTADGQHVRIRTASFAKESESSVGTDAAKIGIGAAIGAAIGGIAGGGKGAGVGAGVGGAAGAGDVLLTRGKAAVIPVETRLSFRLQEPVTLTERLQ